MLSKINLKVPEENEEKGVMMEVQEFQDPLGMFNLI